MPKATVAMDISEDERPSTRKKATAKEASPPADASDGEPGDNGADEEESEFEIEQILKHKAGMFGQGKMGFLVKWKDYGEEHNSWVSEGDAVGAQEVIEEYWATHKRKGGGRRKSTAPVSAARSVGSAADEAISSRKRKSTKASKEDDDAEDELDEDEDEVPKVTSRSASAKKTPASQARATKKQKVDESTTGAMDPESYGNMDKYMKKPSWESMKPHVETVEQVDNNTLMVFFEFTTPGGKTERARCNSTTCNEKFPQTLLKFYEKNLKWRSADSD